MQHYADASIIMLSSSAVCTMIYNAEDVFTLRTTSGFILCVHFQIDFCSPRLATGVPEPQQRSVTFQHPLTGIDNIIIRHIFTPTAAQPGRAS